MKRYYWLSLICFISLLIIVGLFRNSLLARVPSGSLCDGPWQHDLAGPHPFLCGKKVKLTSATLADLTSIHGISADGAHRILTFLAANPSANFNDLDGIRGVGPKTIARLQEYFY